MASDWSDFVPQPRIVYYGCRPWEPAREHVHAEKGDHGEYRASKPRGRCPWCKGRPDVAGDMCPGCNGMPVWAETKLARQRVRARKAELAKRRARFVPKLPSSRKRREKAA